MINLTFVTIFIVAILFISLRTIPTMARGNQVIPNQETLDSMKQEGQFFLVQIAFGDPIRIFVVGREEAKFDPSKLSLTVRRLKPYPGKLLSVDRFNNYFLVNDTKEFRKSTDLEIVTRIDNTDEVFKFKLKNKIP